MPHTFTYAPDFGKLLALVGTRDEALGQAWHVPSAAPTTGEQFAQWIEAEVGHKVNAQFVNSTMVWLLGRFVPTVNEIYEMMYEFNQPFIMDSSKAERAFGFLGTPTRQAIRETIAWVKANPLVKH
jgi:nucleoside-diphosphate-sugar epimerase